MADDEFVYTLQRVKTLPVKTVRNILGRLREQGTTVHSFFPVHGFTAGEFAVAYTLTRLTKSKSKFSI
jgi:hypothetical protein